MASCVKEMIGSCSDEDDSDAWLKTINRGGLWHVNQEVHTLFELIEEYFRHRFSSPGDYYEGSKDIITEELVKDKIFYFNGVFCFAGSSIKNEAGLMTAKDGQVICDYKRFCFRRNLFEMYKQAKQTTICKKKALKKEITSSSGE